MKARIPVLGGAYASCRPDRSTVVLFIDSHIQASHLGRVELPTFKGAKDNVLHLDQAVCNGVQAIGGQSNGGAGCWLKRGQEPWKVVGIAHGEQMVRFTDDGRFFFCASGGSTGFWIDMLDPALTPVPFATEFGVDGIRWIGDNAKPMQLGRLTRFDPVQRISEYTTLDDVVIGQGREVGGLLVLHGNDRRIVEPGDAFFIKASRAGNTLAVALIKQRPVAERGAVFHFLDVSELTTFPLEAPPIVLPKPVCATVYTRGEVGACPICGHPKSVHAQKEPEVPPVSTPNMIDVVRAEFARHPPAPNSTESCGEFTRRVVWTLNPTGDPQGFGLLSKSPGEAQYDGTAVDATIYGATQQVIDIIGGAEGPNPQPGWMEQPKRSTNNWTTPIRPKGDVPDEPPDEEPGDPDGVDAMIVAAITAFRGEVAEMIAHATEIIMEAVNVKIAEIPKGSGLTDDQKALLVEVDGLLDALASKDGIQTDPGGPRFLSHAHNVKWKG